jgi:hypothetical protein
MMIPIGLDVGARNMMPPLQDALTRAERERACWEATPGNTCKAVTLGEAYRAINYTSFCC